MENLHLILPEIFVSIAIMFFLIIGVFKKNSSSLVYNLSTLTLVVLVALIYNLNSISETAIFNGSYKIDKLANFMKLLMIGSGIFVMLTSSKYLQINNYKHNSTNNSKTNSQGNSKFISKSADL